MQLASYENGVYIFQDNNISIAIEDTGGIPFVLITDLAKKLIVKKQNEKKSLQ